MATMHGRFAASPIAPALAAGDGGLSLTSNAASTLDGKARSDIALGTGTWGVEFTFWGEDALQAAIGLCTPAAATDAEVGATGGIGWRLHSGEVVNAGSVVATGLPAIAKGDVVGLRVQLDGSRSVAFYRNGDQVYSAALGLTGALHFAVSLATTQAGGLHCIVNAGQWQGFAPASAGWPLPAAGMAPLHLAAEDYMSAPGDAPANHPYIGCVADSGLDAIASVSFWPWASNSRAGTAALRLLDAEGLLDAVALGDVRDVPVQVRQVQQGQPLTSASAVSRFVLERIDIEDDGRKTAVLRDPHDDLDAPLHRAVFLPSINDQLAWQPQPVVIGAVRSLPSIPVNSDGSVQWLCDAPLASVERVLDRGAQILAGDGYALVAGGQQLSFDSPPIGPVLVDTSSIGAGMQPATLEQALKDVFRRINKSAWSVADAAAIDVATGYAGVGYYAGEGGTPREALTALLASYTADWWQDGDGVLRVTRLLDPDTIADEDLAFDLDWRELKADLVVSPDLAPHLTRRMAYQPNAQPLSSGDMITDMEQLPPAVRQQLMGDYRGQVYAGGPLASRYQRAEAAAPMLSRFDQRADAQAEIDRVVALYAVPRHFYSGQLAGRPDIAFRPGQIGRITYPRYGLQAGRKVLVTSVSSNPVTGRHSVRFWGA